MRPMQHLTDTLVDSLQRVNRYVKVSIDCMGEAFKALKQSFLMDWRVAMIYVLAFVKTKPEMLSKALDLYRELVPKVLATEPGCMAYVPTTDFDPCLPNQSRDNGTIVVSERWNSIEDFKAHLNMAHSIEFRSRIQHYLEQPISVRITQRAI
jgi:quinol monooxygenase YgiN